MKYTISTTSHLAIYYYLRPHTHTHTLTSEIFIISAAVTVDRTHDCSSKYLLVAAFYEWKCCYVTAIQWSLCIQDTLGPTNSVLIIKVSWFSRSVYIIKNHLGPQLSVWIMQVSSFSSVLINRFHCTWFFLESWIKQSNAH